jgi:hypothetical protein
MLERRGFSGNSVGSRSWRRVEAVVFRSYESEFLLHRAGLAVT